MLNTTAIGYLGQDATLQETNGKTVLNFSIAHSEKWKDGHGVLHERTTWVNCSMWDKANLVQYLKKGTQVFVSGTPSVSAYLSKKENKPAADLRLSVQKLELLGGNKQAAPAAAPQAANNGHVASGTEYTQPTEQSSEPVDDLPF